MDFDQMLLAATAFGGAYVGASMEVRKLRAQLAKIQRLVTTCPHHAEAVKAESITP